MDVLPDLKKDDRHAGILTDWDMLCARDLEILFQGLKDLAACRICFSARSMMKRFLHVGRKHFVHFNAHLGKRVAN